MAFKTFFAHLADEPSDEALLRAACVLGEQHGAHLVGLHVSPPLYLYVSYAVSMPVDVAEQWERERQATDERLKATFENSTASGDFVAEWLRLEPVQVSVEEAIVEVANTADALLLGRGFDDKGRLSQGWLQRLLERSARPTFVIPDDFDADAIGRRVFVAWDGSRESTLALFAALPQLMHADEVRLHRINQPQRDRHHLSGITGQLAASLARHGVPVELATSDARPGEIADELLGFANDMGADLLVMGCYGHGRFRELVLGSTTRQVLSMASMPLLMHS